MSALNKWFGYILGLLLGVLILGYTTTTYLRNDMSSFVFALKLFNQSPKYTTSTIPKQSSLRTSIKVFTTKPATTNPTIKITNRVTEATELSTTDGTATSAIVTTEYPYLKIKKYFTWSMSARQMTMMLSLLRVFVTQIEKYNITYMPCGGTLVGINRHHGMIPWDDDIDIVIPSAQKPMLINALAELSPTYNLKMWPGEITGRWKFYKTDGDKIPYCQFRYPYIDIFFMRDLTNDTLSIELYPETSIKKTDIYPMVRRPYNGILLNTPCNMEAILQESISSDHFTSCKSAAFNHSLEEHISDGINIDCSFLKNDFPFVRRKVTKFPRKLRYKEDLMTGNKLIQSVSYSAPIVCNDVPSYYPSDLEVLEMYN